MTTGRINQVTILSFSAPPPLRAKPCGQPAAAPLREPRPAVVRFRSKKSLKLFIVTLRLLGVLSVFFARKRAVVWEQRGPEVLRSRHVAHRLQFASPWPSLAGSHPERPQNCVASSAARREGQRRTSHQIQACQKVPRWSGLPRQRTSRNEAAHAGRPPHKSVHGYRYSTRINTPLPSAQPFRRNARVATVV